MEKATDRALEEALAYMCNLPKKYVEELELNKNTFFSILGNLSDFMRSEGNDSDVSRYMLLQYDVIQRYCSEGFPHKYVYSYYRQYCRTINAAILIYYKAVRSDTQKFGQEEYEELFGTFFLNEQTLKDLENEDIIFACVVDVKDKINKENRDGYLRSKFEENWKQKRTSLLENQIAYGQIIRDHFTPVEEFDKLVDQGATLKRAINFLDKLETESHDRGADDDIVLVPYKEYHALHELLLESPWEKAILEEKHAKIASRLERIFSGQVKKPS